MATTYWTNGNSNGNFNDAGNWSGGAVPVSTDTAVFDGRSNDDCSDGSGVSAVDLAELRIERAYTGDIGGSTPLTISADKVVHRGTGKLTYVDGSNTTDRMEIDSSNTTDCADISGSTITELTVTRGNVTLSGTSTFTDIYVDSSTNRTADATLTIGANITYTDLTVNGGTVTDNSGNNATNVVVSIGATYTNNAAAARTITLLSIYGGTVTLSPVNVALTVTQASHFGGTTTHSGRGSVTYTDSDAWSPATLTFDQHTTLTSPMVLHGTPTINGATGKTIQFS